MSKPLPIYIVPRRTVERLCGNPPVPSGDLANYLSLRPGILDDGQCDIFQPNVRSEVQRWKIFDIFRIVPEVEDEKTVVVFPFWLELFENFGCRHKIAECLAWLQKTYPRNPTVIQWNHDRDAATVPELRNLPFNFRVIQFNTSNPTGRDVIVPFWTIRTDINFDVAEERRFRGGFAGYVGRLPARRALFDAFHNRPGWFVQDTSTGDRFDQDVYLGLMQSFTFALCPRGGGMSSYRLYEALQCGAIPVLFADDYAKPYPDLNWDEFCVTIPEKYAGNADFIDCLLSDCDVLAMRARLHELRPRFSLLGVQLELSRRIRELLA